MAEGFTENVTIDEGVNRVGVRRQIHLEGEEIIVQETFDAAPYMKEAEQARIATAGQRWGDGRVVGTIDPVAYARISKIKDRSERDKAILAYFREKPAMVKFDGYFKTLNGTR